MKKIKTYLITGIIIVSCTLSCKDKSSGLSDPCTDINVFSLNEDKQLGQQVAAEIGINTVDYPILDEAIYPVAYAHLKRIRDKILNSGKVVNKTAFNWEVKIIKNDSTLNAFCTPGGYIYVYTGIIKYLDNEDDFAGVLGHEIAHADRRHSTKALTRDYGISTLIGVIAGKDPGLLVKITKQLADLKNSRCHESEADEMSVIYLSATNYKCNGAASFFEKIEKSGQPRVPEFLSTHPSPGNRVGSINEKANALNCNKTTPASDGQYAAFKNSLP